MNRIFEPNTYRPFPSARATTTAVYDEGLRRHMLGVYRNMALGLGITALVAFLVASVPALPGCVTYGRTLAEAREMAKDAVSGYIESLRKHKEPVPTDDETLVTSLDLDYAQVARR